MKEEKKSIIDHHACSYVTFNTIDWIDVFIRPGYKQVITDALNSFVTNKKLIIFSWCLMTNHLHLLARSNEKGGLAQFEKDFKKQTTKEILEAIDGEPELRHNWMLAHFEAASQQMKRLEKYTLWQNCSNPVFIDFKDPYKLKEKVLHIHENPLRDLVVDQPEDYLHSSARDYVGRKGLVQVNRIDFEDLLKAIITA
ncbi:MAG: transposase [Candidatus Pseudobacter hemicellulosilyticus]|uniref:Transposase n=1 Tax=Candidatus Pseudobacter hemicellulosilyticus TaxID=3121375 RepID=A0AAJ6BJ10_9BACT|nr:MAG: transposase [Pseudobacter sp.]